jgi:tape measure domain-containing protein
MAQDINIRIGANITDLQKKLGEAQKSLAKSGRKMQRLGSDLMMSLTAPLAGLGVAAVKAAGDFEAMSNGLTAIMGDADAAAAELEKLKEAAKNPGLGFQQAVKGSVRLQSVGISAEAARENMLAMGNAIALVGGGAAELDRATLAMQQIGAKGKISAEEINQLNEVIPQIRSVMNDTFGTSDGQELEKMGVDANAFILQITKGLDKLPKAQGGIKNAIENTGIAMQSFLASLGTELNEAFNLQENVEAFANKLTAISERFANLDANSKKVILTIAAIVAALGPAIFAFGTGAKLFASLSGHINIVVGMLGKMQAMINLVVVAETRSILLTRAKTTALKLYNATLSMSNAFLNLFKISTYKNIAATIAQTTATIATNAAIFAGVAIIQTAIAIETAYVAVKKVLTGQIKITTIAQKAFNLMLAANPIGLAIAAIMGLIAAFTFAYQNLDWFRKFVDNSLKFISDKFSWMLAKVKFVFKNFPAILKAGWAALKQFAANIKNKLKVLGMNAESFRLKFARALTIDKDKRAEFTKQINKIGTETKGIKENAKNIGDVFNETLSSEIKKVKNIKVPDLKMEAVTAAPSLSSATMPSANVATNTTGTKKTTAAITEQKKEVASLATELEGLNTFQAESSFLSNRMALSMNSLTTAQSAFSEKMETMKTAIADFNNGLTDLVNTGLSDLAAGLGEGLGAMAAGTGNLQTMAGSLLSTLGGMLMQLGKMAIQTGIAIFGIKKALQSLNPAVAIAGGIALVALAKMVSSKAAKISEAGNAKMPAFANGGFVTKPTLGLFGEKGPEAVIPKRRLDSLLSSAENGGGMGTLTTRISGSDLEIVLDKTKRKNNRIR